MDEKLGIFEKILFGVSIIFEVVTIWFRLTMPVSEISQLNTFLIGFFDFLFSVYIGYFVQKVDAVRRYRENLKRYGLLAYRRIMDIQKSIERTMGQLEKIGNSYPKERVNEIEALHLVLEGTFDTVESSISDWLDIIGKEIRKKEEIESLQVEQQVIEQQVLVSGNYPTGANDETLRRLDAVKKEISSLKADLPPLLRKGINSEYPPSTLQIFAEEANKYSHIRFRVIVDKSLTLEVAKLRSPYSFRVDYFDTFIVRAIDKDGNQVGYVENPFPQVRHNDFTTDFMVVLKAAENAGGQRELASLTEPITLHNAIITSVKDGYMVFTVEGDSFDFSVG